MDLSPEEYQQYVKEKQKKSPLVKNLLFAFVIGGASVYNALIGQCDTAYVTKIQKEFPADCWFPNLDEDPAWQAEEPSEVMEQDGVRYQYVTYRRVK